MTAPAPDARPAGRTEADFTASVGPLRTELLAHCYRMSGSVSDAEDLVQETYLRAWRAFHSFDGRSSVRTWMYRIATNACLSATTSASRRVLPTGLGQPAGDPAEDLVERRDIAWVEPLPDRVLWGQAAPDPAERALSAEGIALAYVTAVQALPPRQRAALVLREVVGLSAAETAELIGASVAAVNSAVQRARATLTRNDAGAGAPRLSELSEADERAVEQFVAAFESHDLESLTRVLSRDVVWQMPPFDRWYLGARDAITLSAVHCPARAAGDLCYRRASCNGQPAVGMYLLDADGRHTAFQLQVLDIADGRIGAVTGFFDTALFAACGLPASLS